MTGKPKRRWNKWGDDSIKLALNGQALAFLRLRYGRIDALPDGVAFEAAT